jgi:hypothetical protein
VLSRGRSRLTYANVVSTLCLFVLLGGSAVALEVVPFAKQAGFAKNAGKVDGLSASKKPRKNKLLALSASKKFPASVLPEGFAGPAGDPCLPINPACVGPKGDTGDPGTNGAPGVKGDAGAKGDPGSNGAPGVQGNPGPFPDPLQSGKTLRGFWGHGFTADAAGEADNTFYSFVFTLPAAPTPHFIPHNGAAPAGCTGGTVANPKADPGHLCVYEIEPENSTVPSVCSINGCSGADDNGFQIARSSAAAGFSLSRGSWAVTAP